MLTTEPPAANSSVPPDTVTWLPLATLRRLPATPR